MTDLISQLVDRLVDQTLVGGRKTGDMTVDGTTATEIAQFKTLLAAKLRAAAAGGSQSLAQVLAVGNNANALKITNVANPTADQDVVTKKYFEDNPSPGGSSYLSKTYAEMQTLIAATELVPGTLYKISDRGDRGLFFQAISTTQLAKDGTRLMLCPARYSTNETLGGNVWKGVWNSGKSVVADDLMIHGGKVWQNLTGNIGTADDDVTLDNVNWVLIPKASFSNGEYVEREFGVNYDFANDWIDKQWDSLKNVFGMDWALEQSNLFGFNFCDVSDWNYGANDDGYPFYDNKGFGVFNNSCEGIYVNQSPSGIYNNKNSGEITGNIVNNEIRTNSNTGSINTNRVLYIINNTNSGHIQQNIIMGSVNNNSNGGAITKNTNHGDVQNNANAGAITNNSNNGTINNIGAANSNIINNTNNGDITTTTTGVISDTTVNK